MNGEGVSWNDRNYGR